MRCKIVRAAYVVQYYEINQKSKNQTNYAILG